MRIPQWLSEALRRALPLAPMLLVLATLLPLPGTHAQASAAAAAAAAKPGSVSNPAVEAMLTQIVDSLAHGHEESANEFRRAGLTDIVDDILHIDGVQLFDIESEELLREIYRRAEAARAGQGEQLLAHLYSTAAKEFPAVREDPNFAPLRQLAKKHGAIDPAQFVFAEAAQAAKVVLPAHVDAAVQELAYVYSHGNLSELSRISMQAFRMEQASMSRYLAQSRTVRDALHRLITDHGSAPPPVAEALRTIMKETAKGAHAVSQQKSFADALRLLDDAQRGFDTETDDTVKQVAEREDTLGSRSAQRAQLDGAGKFDATMLAAAKQQFNDYAYETYGPDNSGGGGGGGGGDGHPKSSASHYSNRTSAEVIRARGPLVSRTYNVSIRSARGGRGIVAGAAIASPPGMKVTAAAWVANPSDARFGRIALEISPADGGARRVALSRSLFADSVLVAANALWGGHAGLSVFRQGDVLLMESLDPYATVDAERTHRWEQKLTALRDRAEAKRSEDDIPPTFLFELMQLESERRSIPRRLVFHPSALSRELAWSMARIDFWFNDIAGLADEVKASNGETMPAQFHAIEIEQAQTWQFHERPGTISIEDRDGGIARLVVRSAGVKPAVAERSHYAVAMFALDEEGPEGSPLAELDAEIQPMLDWLAWNHHDFMRLNDFAEALALLRWAKSGPTTFDHAKLAAAAKRVPSPDRLVDNAPQLPPPNRRGHGAH